ncbi:YPL264C [Symbiodinium sp. CCMP2592]|nr:YPL264C [Symbiodinium sp. CCMP2592]
MKCLRRTAPEAILGMLAQAASSLTFAGVVVVSDWLEHQGWPAFAMLGVACVIMTLGLLVQLCSQSQVQWPTSSSQKVWLFARGFSSVFSLGGFVVATVFGCPAGDALVMGSTNVLASAVAGCLLFGEAFGKWKVAAVLATMAGAVLVAKPEFLFTSVKDQPYLGYFFASVGGLGLSGLIVCCRKLGKEVSPLVSSLSASAQRGAMTLLLAALPLWNRDLATSVEILGHHPGLAALWVLILVVLVAMQTVLVSVGSAMAPASTSGVIVTCCDILFGYVGQIVVMGIMPDGVTLAGVALILGSVYMVTMDTVSAGTRMEAGTSTEEACSKSDINIPGMKDEDSSPKKKASQHACCSHWLAWWVQLF